MCPGSNQYVIGAPYLDKMTLNLENGNQVTITREGKGCYIKSMTIDGKPYTRNYLDHEQLMKGCRIHYIMSDKPNYSRGTGKGDLPYSFSR